MYAIALHEEIQIFLWFYFLIRYIYGIIFESDSAEIESSAISSKNGIAMLIHYCVIAFKNIWKYKVSASISILGLAFASSVSCPYSIGWIMRPLTILSTRIPNPSTVSIAPRNNPVKWTKEPRKVSRIAYESKSQLSKPPPRLCFQPKTAVPKRLLISKWICFIRTARS